MKEVFPKHKISKSQLNSIVYIFLKKFFQWEGYLSRIALTTFNEDDGDKELLELKNSKT